MSWINGAGACPFEYARLDREQWQAVVDALDGDDSCRDAALDALNMNAPQAWLDEQND